MFDLNIMLYLYPPHGGRALGYYCIKCGAVTKTERGMWAHCRQKHKIKKQEDLKFEPEAQQVASQ